MRELENIAALEELSPDFMGFIFYKKSARNIDGAISKKIKNSINSVGVFVNEELEKVVEKVNKETLCYVQLHGEETPSYCQALKQKGIKIIKAFAIDENFDFDNLKVYEAHVNYFLFDAKGVARGGNGISFDWSLLQKYKGEIPFLLAGGIDETMAKDLKKIKHQKFLGVDLNSKFEVSPGLKDIQKLKQLIYELRS